MAGQSCFMCFIMGGCVALDAGLAVLVWEYCPCLIASLQQEWGRARPANL